MRVDLLGAAKQWSPEDDPITQEQLHILELLLEDELTLDALEGFLIVCSRFVDEFGNHRTRELADIFRTSREEGRKALLASLEHMKRWIGGIDAYQQRYPVIIIPPKPAFPQFKIVGIENIAERLFRVLDSRGRAYPTDELIRDFIIRTGRLPAVPRQRHPVRRSKPYFHWCSYNTWEDPKKTRQALQILPEWSDCQLRATLPTSRIKQSAYVAFNGDRSDPTDSKLRFYKYYYEPLAQDHPPLDGGGPQIGVEGSPIVDLLEEWDDASQTWKPIWVRS